MQWVFRYYEYSHLRKLCSQTSATTLPLTKCCGDIHQSIQTKISEHHLWQWKRLNYASMGTSPYPVQTHPQSTAAIKHKYHCIIIRLRVWNIWLQKNAPQPNVMCRFIHEKSGVRDSWYNHAVYSWYLYMSPEHYLTHVCRVKKTNAKQVSDTVVFQHKNTTNPIIMHADWFFKAIHNLKESAKEMSNGKGYKSMQDLKSLTKAANNLIRRHTLSANKTAPTKQPHLFTTMGVQVNARPSLRVPMTETPPTPWTQVDMH